MPATARDRLVGISCAVLSVLLFSSFTLVSRLGLSSTLTLPDLAALRFGIGGTLLLPVLVRGDLRRATWRDAAALAFLGGLGVLSPRVGLPPATASATVAVLSSAAFLPVYAVWPGTTLLAAGARELLLQAAVQGALIGAMSIFVYTRAVAALGPATTALFAAAVPCVTTLAAVPLLSERPSRAALAGIAVVTVGMVVAVRVRAAGAARAAA